MGLFEQREHAAIAELLDVQEILPSVIALICEATRSVELTDLAEAGCQRAKEIGCAFVDTPEWAKILKRTVEGRAK